jgi:hypothetical protein
MKKWNVLAAILAIVIIEGIALYHGINGVALSASMAIIGGLGGYAAKNILEKKP